MGYTYKLDKDDLNSENWKCCVAKCPGRAVTGKEGPPVNMLSQLHSFAVRKGYLPTKRGS